MRTTIILPALVMAAAVKRQKELNFKSLGLYLESLVRYDYKKEIDGLGSKWAMPELESAAAPYYAKEAEEKARDLRAKKAKKSDPETDFIPPQFRDVLLVSLSVLSSIPAGWPDERVAVKAKREVRVAKGRFPEGAFGLDVTGESMNAARGKFGPILDGETVVLLAPDRREPKHGDIVAALCDGRTTLKRLWCKPKPCVLRAESTAPEFVNDIRPAHDLVIQGVVVGKL